MSKQTRASRGRPAVTSKPEKGRVMQFQDYTDALAHSEQASQEPVYVISVVSELVGVHAQTLRHYERLGLVVPARTGGNIRLYSQRDVERLIAIVRLTGELGVNLAGVEAILRMRRRIAELQHEIEELESELRGWRGYLLEDSRARRA